MSAAVEHAFPRAFEAAQKVDPLILAGALDHIAKTAKASRSQTRRIRWIEQRALIALRGEEFRAIDVELPKSAGPDTPEKLERRMAFHIAIKNELLAAAQKALTECCDLAETDAGRALEAAIAKATGQEGGAA